MIESEWLTCNDPERMLAWAIGANIKSPYDITWVTQRPASFRFSDRQLRLFVCACARHVWDKLHPYSQAAVATAERMADGNVDISQIKGTVALAHTVPCSDPPCLACIAMETLSAKGPAVGTEWFSHHISFLLQADLLREIVGNPFAKRFLFVKPIPVPGGYQYRKRDGSVVSIGEAGKVKLLDVAWLTPTVLSLAHAAYEDRVPNAWVCRCGHGETVAPYRCSQCGVGYDAPNGCLDPLTLLALADALEEAGCDKKSLFMDLRNYQLCQGCDGTGKRHCMVDAGYGNPLMQREGWKWCYVCNDYGRGIFPGWARQRNVKQHYRGYWIIDLLLGKE